MNTAEKIEDPTLLVRRCIDCCQGFKKDRLAIDVGAYIGLWTTYLAGSFERVMAFEPIDEHLVLLRRNTENQSNVVCRAMAVADRVAGGAMRKKKFDFPVPDAWTLLQYPTPGLIGEESIDGTRAVVPITTLDALALQNVDFIKINTNGGEYEVVVGAFTTIREQKPLVLVSEKLDPHRRASRLLKYYGMQELLVWDRNYLFGWAA